MFVELEFDGLFIFDHGLWIKLDDEFAYSFDAHFPLAFHYFEEVEPTEFMSVEVFEEDEGMWGPF